jgi:hypothetical protein
MLEYIIMEIGTGSAGMNFQRSGLLRAFSLKLVSNNNHTEGTRPVGQPSHYLQAIPCFYIFRLSSSYSKDYC